MIKRDILTALTHHRPAQQLRTGPRSRVLLHVLNKPVSFGVARQLAVHQEGALDVSVGAHQLLQLLGGEGVGQVGEAEQGVGGLQGDVDQAAADSAVVEGADGILSLVPVQQSHKGWRRGHYGDSDEEGGRGGGGRRQEQTHRKIYTDINGWGRVRDKHKHTFKVDIEKHLTGGEKSTKWGNNSPRPPKKELVAEGGNKINSRPNVAK